MKSSLGKLRKFVHKNDAKEKKDTQQPPAQSDEKRDHQPSVQLEEKRDFQPSAELDELAQASQDMLDMRNCYDSLLSAAAATANSAYEFSESLREMGACLLEKTSLNDDEENGNLLLMLGKAQFELQKLVDSYRSHIFLTITTPSESLLNELRTVEEMKRQCDEKRKVYQYMMEQQRQKGRSKSGKGESFMLQQLQTAHEEYDEEATLCVFRLKSLKQGQCRSLLTQAARHHAAQLNFFRKGLKSLEAVEPHVRLVTEQQHIDYQFSGLEDEEGESWEDDSENIYHVNDDAELSFDYRQNKPELDVVSSLRNSMELDQVDHSIPQTSSMENAEVHQDKDRGDLQVSSRERRVVSHSAPIFAEKFDPPEKIKQMQPSSARKLHTYVLPTPVDAKSSIPPRTSNSVPRTRPTSISGRTNTLWHSSPLELKKHEKDSGDDDLSGIKAQSVLKESNRNKAAIRLPPPLAEGLSHPHFDTHIISDTKKIKRHAFSGPLTSNQWSTKPALSASGPITSTELPQLVSGLLSHVPNSQPTASPKVSPSASPPLSSPKIGELHQLPRPPGSLATKPARSFALIGHSAPLIVRNQEPSATNKTPLLASHAASPLPTPPLTVPRSFSIPSSNQRATAHNAAKLLDSPQVADRDVEVASPPLTPITLSNMKSVEVASHSGQIRGGR